MERPYFHPRLMVHHALVLAITLLASLSAGVATANSQIDANDILYQQNIRIEGMESNGATVLFEVINENPNPPIDKQDRISASRWLVVPPGSMVTFEVIEAEWSVHWDSGEMEGPFSMDDTSTAGAMPANLRRVAGNNVGIFRSVGLNQTRANVTTTVSRSRPDYRRGVAAVDRMIVEARITGGLLDEEVYPVNLSERDPYLLDFLSPMVINPEQIQEFSRRNRTPAFTEEVREWNDLLQAANRNVAPLMAPIPEPGIYFITPSDLGAAGVDIGRVNYESIRFFAGNQPIPALRLSNQSGPFTGNDILAVYVPAIRENRYPYIPLWLLILDEADQPDSSRQATEFDAEAFRRSLAEASASTESDEAEEATGEEPEVRPFGLTARTYIFTPREYDKINFPFTSRTGQWAMAVVNKGSFTEEEFEVRGVDSERPAKLKVSLAGVNNSLRQLARLYINGESVSDRFELSGRGPFERTVTVPAGLLKNGINVLSIEYPDQREQLYQPRLVVNWAEVEYPVELAQFPINRHVTLTGEPGQAVGITIPRPVDTFANFPFLVDVTDPFNPKTYRVRGSRPSQGRTVYAASVLAGEEERKLIYADESIGRSIPPFRQVPWRNLITPRSGTDYLVVIPEELKWGIEQLVDYRSSRGLDVEVVTAEEAFAFFGFGERDYQPVYNMVQHVFESWPGRRMQYLLLVGEASEYWWEHRHNTTRVAPNMLPIHGFADPNVTVNSDDSYGLIAGEDALTDIEVGRISAETPEEVAAVARMVWEYENARPHGPWEYRHAFFTDDEPEFRRVVERILATQFADEGRVDTFYLQEYPYEDYFRIINRKRSVTMTNEIIDAFSEGLVTATYVGHGGPNIWSSERILHYRDLPLINSGGRRAIVASGSCDTAWIDYPIDPVRKSLGEHLILNESGGAIALFAPIAGTTSFEHDFLLRRFFEAVHDDHYKTVGEASNYARLQYLLERNQKFVSNQYILMGDPAIRIPTVSRNLQLNISPPELFADEQGTIRIEGVAPNIDWGTVEAVFVDSIGTEVIAPVRSRISRNRFTLELQAPAWITPGRHRLIVDAWSSGRNTHENQNISIPVIEPTVELVWESSPDVTAGPIPAGETVDVALRARNTSEGYMENLVLRIRDAARGTELSEHPIILEPGEERVWRFGLRAPNGITVFEATVDYQNQEPRKPRIAESRMEMRAIADGVAPLAVGERLIEVDRVAAPDTTTFTVPLYNVGTDSIENIRAVLRLMDSETGSPVGQPRDVTYIPAGGKAELTFSANSLFPEGTLGYRLTVSRTTGEQEQLAEMSFPVEIIGGHDVVVVRGSVRTERNSYVRSETVYVEAMIRNQGQEPVHNLQTSLFVDTPWDSNALADAVNGQSVVTFAEPLMPGESRPVRLRWDPTPRDPMNVRLHVVTNSDRRLPETNFANNVGDVAVSMMRLPNLALIRDGIEISQDYVRRGDVISITVPFENDSPFDFPQPFVTEIRAHGPGVSPELIYRVSTDGLASGERAILQAAWTADGVRDRIEISLNDDRDYGEQRLDDNTASLPLIYLVNTRRLRQADGTWSLRSSFPQGDRHSMSLGPDGALVMFANPGVVHVVNVLEENLVDIELPTDVNRRTGDNMMTLWNRALVWRQNQEPDPVRLRYRLGDGDPTRVPGNLGVTMHDVYVNLYNPAMYPGREVNSFEFRVGDERDFTPLPRRNESLVYLGRFETGDNIFEIEIAPGQVRADNSIFGFRFAPIMSWFNSAIYEMDGMPEMVFDPDLRAPGETRAIYDIRVSSDSHVNAGFSEWTRIEAGQVLAADPGLKLMQVRATLIGDGEEVPTLRDIRFVPRDQFTELAAGE